MSYNLATAFVEVKGNHSGIDSVFKGIESGIHQLLHGFASLSPLLEAGLGLASIGLALREFMHDAEAAIQTETKLNAVIRATGNAARLSTEDIIGMSEEMLKTGIFGTTEIQNASARLLQMRAVTKETYPEIIRLSADLAAAGFGTVESAATSLGRALSAPERGLYRLRSMGIIFTQAEEHKIRVLTQTNRLHEAQEAILEKVKNSVGGLNEELAKTPVGQWKQIRNQLEEISVKMGRYIWPYAVDIARAALMVASALGRVVSFVMDIDAFFGRWPGRLLLIAATVYLIPHALEKAHHWIGLSTKLLGGFSKAWVMVGTQIDALVNGPIQKMSIGFIRGDSLIKKMTISWRALNAEMMITWLASPVGMLVATLAIIAAIAGIYYTIYRYVVATEEGSAAWVKLWKSIQTSANMILGAMWQLASIIWEVLITNNPFFSWMPSLESLYDFFVTNFIPLVTWYINTIAEGLLVAASIISVIATRISLMIAAVAALQRGKFEMAGDLLGRAFATDIGSEIRQKIDNGMEKLRTWKGERRGESENKADTLDLKSGFTGFADAWKQAQESLLKDSAAERTAQGVQNIDDNTFEQRNILEDLSLFIKGNRPEVA